MKFHATTDKNRQLCVKWDLINAYLSRWKPGTELDFTITRTKKTASSPMRKYYYAVVLPMLMEALGYEPEESLFVHRQLKIVFFGVEPDKRNIYREKDIPVVFGEDSDHPNSVRSKFIEWAKRKGSEAGVYIPDPNE